MSSKGKKLSADITYYVSRLCPGKKDYLSVRDENGSKTQVQKRLILSNLREVYVQFKKDYEDIHVGFSTFCNLQPKHCILAVAVGTHSLCICAYHQNPKLQLNAIGEKGLCLQDVMAKAVCNLDEEECMMRRCKSCPGIEGVVNYPRNLPALDGKVEIRYKTWVTVDRCNLEDKVETVEEFLDSFSSAVVKLLRHHFVSKKQAIFYKKTKNNLELDEGLLVMDFSENYSFIVQDAAQGYHWENSQCTLHPFVFYFKMQDSTIGHESFCFISDSTKHSTAMVYTFLKKLIPHLKQAHDQIRKIIYFSDDCAARYKNRYSFINLIRHYEDFGLKVEWNFFPTSHGIGGTLKRSTARASLQRNLNDQILTPMDFYHYCQESISTITTYYTRAEEVEEVQKLLAPRLN